MSDFDFSMSFDFSGGLFDDPTSADGIELETARQLKRPLTHERRAAKREFISGMKREALNQLIPTLPPPDTDLYVVGNGAGAEIRHGINPLAFDFGSFIPHIVEQLGGANCTAYISTWTANANHVNTLIDMLAGAKKPGRPPTKAKPTAPALPAPADQPNRGRGRPRKTPALPAVTVPALVA